MNFIDDEKFDPSQKQTKIQNFDTSDYLIQNYNPNNESDYE